MQAIDALNNRYHVQAQIGTGGMGTVYRALDRLTGQVVALKQLRIAPNQLAFNSRTTNADARLAIAREFRTLATLRHPHIISVLDYGFDAEQQPFFTMTLLEKPRTLLDALRDKPIQMQVVRLIEVLQALTYLHRRGIVHRDLKPDNILVDAHDTLRLLDFGLAIQPDDSKDIAGTPLYMAPETLRSQGVSFASDLYAVGVMAYELFSGQHPFQAADGNITTLLMNILHAEPDLEPLLDHANLYDVVANLLQKDPAARYQTAEEVVNALCYAAGLPLPTEDTTIRESFLQAAEFVGREAEMQTLQIALDHITHRRQAHGDALATAYLIGGESGVGKSRLIDELRIRAMVRGVTVLRGQAVEGGGLPFQLWRQLLRRLVISTPISDLEAGILKPLVPDIDALLGQAVADVEPLPGTRDQQRLVLTISALFERQTQPVLLILEDLQWADESLAPLRRLIPLTQTQPLMIVGNYRSDERPTLPDELNLPAIQLSRLTQAEIMRLSASMLGQAGMKKEVVDLLQQQTEGNVFFIVEVVRALAEDAGRLSDIGTRTLPDTVFAHGIATIINGRLQRIPDWAQPLLRLAAVLGRQIDEALLTHATTVIDLSGAPVASDDVHDVLPVFFVACNAAAVLEVNETTWQFTHDKLREGLLALLTDDENRTYNRYAAQAIEATYADQRRSYAATLMQHYHAAGDGEHELTYAMLASEVATYHNLYEAQQLLGRAHRLYQDLGLDDKPLLATICYQLGSVHLRSSEPAIVMDWLKQAQDLYTTLGDEVGQMRAASLMAEYDLTQGTPHDALPILKQALAVYEKHQADEEIVRVSFSLTGAYHYIQEYEIARDYIWRAYEISERLNHLALMSQALNNMGANAEFRGQFDEAEPLYERGLKIRREIGDRLGVALSLYNMGWLYEARGDMQQAIDTMREAMTIFEAIGAVENHIAAANKLGGLLRLAGQYDEARQRLQQAIALCKRRSIARIEADCWFHLGMMDLQDGAYAHARAHIIMALRLTLTTQMLQPLPTICIMVTHLLIDSAARAMTGQDETLPPLEDLMAGLRPYLPVIATTRDYRTQAESARIAILQVCRAHYGDAVVDAAQPADDALIQSAQAMGQWLLAQWDDVGAVD